MCSHQRTSNELNGYCHTDGHYPLNKKQKAGGIDAMIGRRGQAGGREYEVLQDQRGSQRGWKWGAAPPTCQRPPMRAHTLWWMAARTMESMDLAASFVNAGVFGEWLQENPNQTRPPKVYIGQRLASKFQRNPIPKGLGVLIDHRHPGTTLVWMYFRGVTSQCAPASLDDPIGARYRFHDWTADI